MTRLALTLVLVASVLSGCASCGSDGAVAEITASSGTVEADDAVEPVAFSPAAVGRRFVVGEAVRTGPGASCDLALAGGGTLHVDPDSVVRFAREATEATPVDVDVEQGSTTVEAPAEAPMAIETVFGVARLDARTRTRIDAREAHFEVVVGHATLDRAGAAQVSLTDGTAVDRAGRRVAPPTTRVAAMPPSSTTTEHIVSGSRWIEVHGRDARMREAGGTDFVALAEGRSQVGEGATLRTAATSTIDIATPDGQIHVGSDSEVQLTATAARAARGSFGLEGGNATRLEVPGGAIVLSAEGGTSSARVELARGGSPEVSVISGTVTQESANGARVLRPEEEDVAPSAPDPSSLAPVAVRAGESIVVHDPGAPTRVRFGVPDGCTGAEWRIDGHGRGSDGGDLVTELRAGAHRYQLACASGARERGSVRIDRDRGVASMPRTAPRTVVDADGRPYSVLYQTLLPEILFRWPHPTGAGPFEIEVQHGSGAPSRTRSATASHTFGSGELGEGTHTLSFRAADGSRSPPTAVRIRFDNATPIASIRAPMPGAPLGASVHVEGTVAEGASVSVSGTPLSVDRGERFSSDVPVPANGCIGIRVTLPGRGIHYYVRCGSGH